MLEEHLDYDTIAKNASIMTDEVAKKLEDIILQRVKDKAWDDVERKVKPVEDPLEYKKRLYPCEPNRKINNLLKDKIFKAAFISIEKLTQRHLRESFELV